MQTFNLFYFFALPASPSRGLAETKVQVGKDQEKAQSEKDSHSLKLKLSLLSLLPNSSVIHPLLLVHSTAKLF